MTGGPTGAADGGPRAATASMTVVHTVAQYERRSVVSPPMARDDRTSIAAHAGIAALTLGALGVVFGDIGTSPLYALQTVFSAHDHAVKPTEANVYGIISLVFWSITSIVSVKYVTFIMRADNEGEG